MPAQVHHFFLEELYNKNSLAKGEMVVFGEQIDLADITIPVYHLAPREAVLVVEFFKEEMVHLGGHRG